MSAPPVSPLTDIRRLYDAFDAPVTDIDCGQMCAPNNPRGVPFCCDIHSAVPAAYRPEWDYLRAATDLWRPYREAKLNDASPTSASPTNASPTNASPTNTSPTNTSLIDVAQIPIISDSAEAETPPHMLLLACQGAARCQRPFRALSCRQFPFYPYLTSWGQFIGLAYDWEFEPVCWVIHNLARVTERFRTEFVSTFDAILAASPDDFKAYYLKSEEMRDVFAARRRRIPLLHRGGGEYRVSPVSERLRKKD
jgi:hypothetical protein